MKKGLRRVLNSFGNISSIRREALMKKGLRPVLEPGGASRILFGEKP